MGLAHFGLMLLVASAAPLHNKILVQTVVVLELSRILMDLYWISRGYYDTAAYVIWIVIHLAIILSGWRLWQQAESNTGLDAAESLGNPARG